MSALADIQAACAQVRNRVSLSAVISRSGVALKRKGKEWVACCPFHADRSPSFTVYADDCRFMCFGCGAEGDVLDFMRRAHGVSLTEAIHMLDAGALPIVQRPALPAEAEADRSDEAASIWREAASAAGTPAEAYLMGRGITMPLPSSIRFARLPYGKRGPRHPVLVAAVSALSGEIVGIQRTYLREDGRKAKIRGDGRVKFSLGRVRGGAIRLAPAGPELVITEGLEDGLSLQQELGRPVWVSAGTSMMPAMMVPDLVQAVTIGADNDAAGREAAEKAARAFSASGRAARIMRPAEWAKDFNDMLRGVRI